MPTARRVKQAGLGWVVWLHSSLAAERRRFGYRRLGYLLAREGLVRLLGAHPAVEVAGQAEDVATALPLIAAHRPHLTIAVSEKRRRAAAGINGAEQTEVP